MCFARCQNWMSPCWRNLELSLGGYAGLALGTLYGVELRLGGLVFGIDIMRPAVKLPGFGRIGMTRNSGLMHASFQSAAAPLAHPTG